MAQAVLNDSSAPSLCAVVLVSTAAVVTEHAPLVSATAARASQTVATDVVSEALLRARRSNALLTLCALPLTNGRS